MKKVIVVSKTHLDLGFTDYAENIRQKYIHSFIPDAIRLANSVNTNDKKHFIWTTGSWILKEALKDPKQQENLIQALKAGHIVPHAMPFTTHTELLDVDSLDYGLSIAEKLDKLRGRKTVAAKLTDVPGHTKGLVTLLSRHGIKFLHIGVNGASALVDVPSCFLWKNGDAEIVVVYSGAYGGAFRCDLVDEILYLDHTLDNLGAPSPQKVLDNFRQIQEKYPDYEITAGTMDDFADVIWEVRDKLPVFEGEMGDTWIHGSASDPYKSAALRTLISLKNKWLSNGELDRNSEEYQNFTDAILCISEHTCGMDAKIFFSDYEHYLKSDFIKARTTDKHRYCVIERSWAEQRKYIETALSALSCKHKETAQAELCKLIPDNPCEISSNDKRSIRQGDWTLEINEHGGIFSLKYAGQDVLRRNTEPVITYRSFCEKDYSYWLTHYSRDLEETFEWAIGDFARPLLECAEGKYPAGRFTYTAQKIYAEDAQITVHLVCDRSLCEHLGAPRLIQIIYTVSSDGLDIDVSWYGKDANRLTEAIYFHLFPSAEQIQIKKLGCFIRMDEVTYNGSRNLHAAERIEFDKFEIINLHSPLVSFGKGKILEFDNKTESITKDGLSYVLYNNVWGTNFPLWYEENARFKFQIKKINPSL